MLNETKKSLVSVLVGSFIAGCLTIGTLNKMEYFNKFLETVLKKQKSRIAK